MTDKQLKKLEKISDIAVVISTIVMFITLIWFNM